MIYQYHDKKDCPVCDEYLKDQNMTVPITGINWVDTSFNIPELNKLISRHCEQSINYGINKAISALRSEDAIVFNDTGDLYGRSREEWADWLESKLKVDLSKDPRETPL